MNGHQTLPFSIHRRADVKDLPPGWWLATVARAKALTKVMAKVGHAKNAITEPGVGYRCYLPPKL